MSSTFEAEAMLWTTMPPVQLSTGRYSGLDLSHIRSMLKTAASAFHGVPSWNMTPGRSLNVQVVASGETV